MTRGRTTVIALASAFAACLAGPQLAPAAGPYYADPGGGGTACSPASPCSVNQAVLLAGSGEDVLLAPGTYALSGTLNLNGNLRPQTPGTRPVLHSTSGDKITVAGPTSVVSDIRLETSNVGSAEYALNLVTSGARAERVEVLASGSSAPFASAIQAGATITDSVLAVNGSFAVAVASGGTGGNLRNVTAIATGPNSTGYFTNPSYQGTGVPLQTVTIENSIMRGVAYGISIDGDAMHAVNVNTDHSNASLPRRVVGVGANLNGVLQDADPLFAGAADYHQLSTSPTVNAGAAVPGLSSTDLDGQARNQGAAPDIGADEFVPPAPPGGPAAPAKKKCKKRKAKKKSAAAAKKKCKKRKRK